MAGNCAAAPYLPSSLTFQREVGQNETDCFVIPFDSDLRV